MAFPVLTKEEIIDQLDGGSHWEGSTITYRVAQTTEELTSYYGELKGFSPASPYMTQRMELAMGLWDDLIQANFVKTDALGSDIEIAVTSSRVSYAQAYFPEFGGTIWLSASHKDSDVPVGTYLFMALVHETGHALGLDHMGDYNGDDEAVPSSFQDSMVYTLMSYFGPKYSAAYAHPDVQQADWTNASGTAISAETPMLSDVLAIQSIYGASTTTRTGDTIYGFNYNGDLNRAEIFDFSLNPNPVLAIFDSAGNDTLDLSGWSTPSTIFLEAGKFSSCNDMTKNLSIAYGCVIENAVGGWGSDAVTGNDVANRLSGQAGNDLLKGLGGADVLIGGMGDDTLDGGTGIDTLIGGTGNDVYFVDDQNDVVMESSRALGETDTVYASASYRLVPGLTVENLRLLGKSALNATGNELDNALTGNAGANVLDGGAGTDTLDGGAGADTLIGGTGDDLYVVRDGHDVLREGAAPGDGIDTVRAYLSFKLGANLENLTLMGHANLNGTGNGEDNLLRGNAGHNLLKGGAGADTLDGGAGDDTLVGGTGDDTYIVRDAADVVQERSTAADEIDTVLAYASFTLSANLENLRLRGSADLHGTGNGADNRLTGNAGANVLDGGDGADTLDGGAGADTLIGGTGDDVYVVRDAGDVVTESCTEPAETDTVRSYVDFTLGANLENLQLKGLADLTGKGNALDNFLKGNAGHNVLEGGAGNDTLDGSDGADTLIGGAGDDLYIVDAYQDVVIEGPDAGLDTVQVFNIDFTLGEGLEVLMLMGDWSYKGVGNAANNVIVGSVWSNELDGGAGDDVIIGGEGGDYMTGGSGRDAFVFTEWADLDLGRSRDVITDFKPGRDWIDLSRIDTDTGLDGDQTFELVTTGFGTKPGQLRYADGMISINADTDEDVEFQIQLLGDVPATLSASDFVL